MLKMALGPKRTIAENNKKEAKEQFYQDKILSFFLRPLEGGIIHQIVLSFVIWYRVFFFILWEFLCFIYLFTLFWGLVGFFSFFGIQSRFYFIRKLCRRLNLNGWALSQKSAGVSQLHRGPGSIYHVTGQLNTWRLGIRAHCNEAFWPESLPVTTGGSTQHERFSLMRNPVQHIPEFEVPDRVLGVQKYLWPEH